jgi:hypothetical protein
MRDQYAWPFVEFTHRTYGLLLKILPCALYKSPLSVEALESMSYLFLYYYLICEAIGTAATPGLLCQPRVIVKMIVEKQMECRMAGETEVLARRKPAPAPLLSITKFHMPRPGVEPGPPGWEASD